MKNIIQSTGTVPWWRFKLGTSESFCPRTDYMNIHDTMFDFEHGWSSGANITYGDSTYDTNVSNESASYCDISFSGSGLDLYIVKDSTYGAFSNKLIYNKTQQSSSIPIITPLTSRTCYGDSTLQGDRIQVIRNLPTGGDSYKLRMSVATSSSISIFGIREYGNMTTEIHDDINAFVFDVNPSNWNETITGGTLEENMGKDTVLTTTTKQMREITIQGRIGSFTSYNYGSIEFVNNMKTKFLYYADMQVPLVLIDDKGIDNIHNVYIVPESFTLTRVPGGQVLFDYSMTLREIGKGLKNKVY